MITKMFLSYYILKCVKLLHGHAMYFVVLSCGYTYIFIISYYCCQTLTDLKKFQDLVKELTFCACRNYLSPPTQPENSRVYIVTTWNGWCLQTYTGRLNLMMVCCVCDS